jgi:hypothetical protein
MRANCAPLRSRPKTLGGVLPTNWVTKLSTLLWQGTSYQGNGPWQDSKTYALADKGAAASPAHVRASNGIWGWNQQGYVPGLASTTVVSGLDYRLAGRSAESPSVTHTTQPTQLVVYVRQTVEDWSLAAADNQAMISGSANFFALRWDAGPSTGMQLYMHIDGVWGEKLANPTQPAGTQVDGQAFWTRLIFDGDNGVNGGANLLQLDFSTDQVETPAEVTTWSDARYAQTFTAPGHDCLAGSAASGNIFIGRDSNLATADPATDNIITHYAAIYSGGIDYNATPVCGVDLQSAPPSDGLYTGINGETWTSWWAVDPSDGDYDASGVGTDDPTFLDYDGTKYVRFPGISGNHITTPDSAALDILGDLEMRFGAEIFDQTPSGTTTFGPNKRNSGADEAYYVEMSTTGYLRLRWHDGTAARNAAASTTISAAGVALDAEYAIRLDVDNGASDHEVSFWWRNPGETDDDWVQIGTTVDAGTGAVTSIRATAADVSIGSVAAAVGGTYNVDLRHMKWAQLYDGLVADGGTLVADFNVDRDFSNHSTLTSSTTGEVWTFNRDTAATGLKLEVITADDFAYDGGDFMSFAPPSWLNAASQDFTIIVPFRIHHVPVGDTSLFEAYGAVGRIDIYTNENSGTANRLDVRLTDSGATTATANVSSVAYADGALHVAVVRWTAGSELKFYVDGTGDTATDTSALPTLGETMTTGLIGSHQAKLPWIGRIPAALLADSALSDAEVNAICAQIIRENP